MNLAELVPRLRVEVEPELRELDRLLRDDAPFVAVTADLPKRYPNSGTSGRRSTPFEVILRMLVLRRSYGWSYGATDGVLVEVFEHRWKNLTGGKPLVASAAIYGAFTLAALREIWHGYVRWRGNVMPTLPEEERLFTTLMNSRRVWVLEDGQAFTILFREDY